MSKTSRPGGDESSIARRMAICLLLGAIFGAFCAYFSGKSVPSLTYPILLSIAYNRFTLGLAIGLAGGLRIPSAIRGALLGAVVSAGIAIPSGMEGGLMLLVAGMIYGAIIDLVATRWG